MVRASWTLAEKGYLCTCGQKYEGANCATEKFLILGFDGTTVLGVLGVCASFLGAAAKFLSDGAKDKDTKPDSSDVEMRTR